MDEPLISICIPTFQRSAMLAQALKSVASQADERIEVVICEQPSDDTETLRVVEEFRPRFGKFNYVRNERNIGFDGNFLKVINLATGRYCWPLSDDDQLEPGGLAHVIRALEENADIAGLTLNRFAYNHTYTKRAYERSFRQRTARLFTDVPTMFCHLLDQLAFVSGSVLERAVLTEIMNDPRVKNFEGTGYMPLFMSLLVMQRKPRWLYVPHRCVGWRRDNDSFLAEGALKRLQLDMVAYDRAIAEFLVKNSPEYRAATDEVVTRHVRHHIVNGRLGGAPLSFSWHAWKLCVRKYGRVPSFWLRVAPLIFAPVPLLRSFRTRMQQRRIAAGE
jgi:glycosyltransferase involved in cell wall biosynthesis